MSFRVNNTYDIRDVTARYLEKHIDVEGLEIMRVSNGAIKQSLAFLSAHTLGIIVLGLVLSCSVVPSIADAQEYASADRSAAALGHYARARAMLIEALAEFEEGKRLANPDLLIDSEQWRLTVVSRAEELNRVLDPKPRVTRNGVRYKAHKRFIRHDPFYRNRNIGPKISNTYWEAERREKKEPVRARLTEEAAPSAATLKPQAVEQPAVPVPAAAEETAPAPTAPTDEVFTTVTKEVVAEQQLTTPDAGAPAAAKPTEEVEEEIDAIVQNFASDGVEEDPELLQAIQDVVQSRLDDIDGQAPAPKTE